MRFFDALNDNFLRVKLDGCAAHVNAQHRAVKNGLNARRVKRFYDERCVFHAGAQFFAQRAKIRLCLVFNQLVFALVKNYFFYV